MKTPISFRLRKDLDADLIAAIEKLDKTALKALCRDGLRLMLGIRTTRTMELQERPLDLPQSLEQQRPVQKERVEVASSTAVSTGRVIPGRPAVFFPQQKRS